MVVAATLFVYTRHCQSPADVPRFLSSFQHIELPAKLLDYFLRSNKSNINQWCEMPLLCWERAMCERKAKKDVPTAVVSRAACVSRAPPDDASRLALAGWGRPACSLRVSLLSTIFEPLLASSDSFDYSPLKSSLPTFVIGGDMPLGSENSRYQSRFNENAAFRNFNNTPHAPVVTQREQPTATLSPPNTDLQMDWADACRLGLLPSLNRYFLWILDKGTEYWTTYPRKTRVTETLFSLLKQYITATGRTPHYLRIDNTKEFISQEMVTKIAPPPPRAIATTIDEIAL